MKIKINATNYALEYNDHTVTKQNPHKSLELIYFYWPQ